MQALEPPHSGVDRSGLDDVEPDIRQTLCHRIEIELDVPALRRLHRPLTRIRRRARAKGD